MPINASADLTVNQQITAIYVAYYDRAPDPAGLQFWVNQHEAGQSLEQIATDFSGAAETKEKYAYFSAPAIVSADAFITGIYSNLFGRTPDDTGQDFWTDQLESGSTPVGEIILAILEGAQDVAGGDDDKSTVMNKINAGLDWTESAAEANIGVSGDPIAEEVDGEVVVHNQEAFDSATNLLNNIDGTAQSLADAKAETDAFIATGGGLGETFTLTTNVDAGADFTGTDNNDVFNAPLEQVTSPGGAQNVIQTLTSIDELSGGEDTDRMNARLVDNSADGVLIDGIENLYLRSSDDAASLDMSGVTGAEQVWSDRSTANLSVSALQSAVALGVLEGNGSDFDVIYASGVTSADFTQNVVLQNADIDELDVVDPDGNLTGLALNVTGADVELDLDGDLNDVSSLTIEGDAGLDVTPGSDLDNVETLTSTTTGDVAVNVGDALETASFGEGDDTLKTDGDSVESISMGAGDDEVTIENGDLKDGTAIDMGDGDDRLDLDDNLDLSTTGGVLDTTVSLNGGAGMNTLAMTSATAAAVSTDDAGFDAQFENFQKLEIGEVATSDSATVDLSNMNDIDYVISAGTGPTTGTAEVQTINLGSSDANGGVLTVGGVDITIPSNPGFTSSNQFDVANAIEAQEADIIAANPDVVSVDAVFSGGFFTPDWDVEVTYNTTSGDVPNIAVAENPSTVEFGGVNETDGTDPVNEVQTIEITTPPATNGTVRFEIDSDATTGQDYFVDVEVFQGETTFETAARVADAIDAALLDQFGTVTVSGSTVQIEYDAVALSSSDSDAFDGVFTDTDGTSTAVTWTEVTQGVTPVAETQTVAINSGTDSDGGEIVVAGVRIELDGNLTPNEVAGEILNNLSAIQAASDVVGISYDSNTNELTFNFDEDAGDVGEIQIEDNTSTGVSASVSEKEEGVAGAAAGTLTLDEMASGGTLELTDTLEGDATVNVTDAALAGSTDDEFNIKLNGVLQIANTAALIVANVETVNIETANSDEDNLPTAESDLNLQAADAETVNVSGNHGIDFTGSDLSSMTLLDASGVQATESAPGADDAGAVGYVRIDTGATDEDVTILTGNGNDFIYAGFVGTDPADAGSAATIESGAGDDIVIGSEGDDSIDLGEGADLVYSSAGEDTITLGDGNDTYELTSSSHSEISALDTITDFSPNTVGQGTGGAATSDGAETDVEDRDGDVIDLSAFGAAAVSVATFANASDATTFLANNDADGEMNIALDSSTGYLYIDTDDSGIANSVIELTGVSTIDEAAFEIA